MTFDTIENALYGLHFVPMTRGYAEEIVTWHYPEYPLFQVSPDETEFEIKVLLEPLYNYCVGLNHAGQIVGFCCYGADARVPGGDYAEIDALDVGLGLHPALVGKRLGLRFLMAILAHGDARFAPRHYRATIAVFNIASRRVFEQAGFRLFKTFKSTSIRPLEFVILVKDSAPHDITPKDIAPTGSTPAPR
ncbi:MAG: GNAT family protein [Litorilinea sp.]